MRGRIINCTRSSISGRRRTLTPIALIFLFVSAAVGLVLDFGAGGGQLDFGVHTVHADDNTLQRARELGSRFVVQVFSWSEIEPTRGEFHWEYTDWLLRAAEFYDMRVVARVDKPPAWAASSTSGLSAPPRRLGDYAEFIGEIAARYKGLVAGYIIWNEPNLSREWGDLRPDPAGYTALLRAAAERIRAVDPNAKISSAGLAPTNENSDRAMDDREFLRGMYAAGVRDTFDILAAHPYGFSNPPDDPHGAHKGLNFRRLEDLREIMVENGDAGKPVWLTEFGYTTSPQIDSPDLDVTEEEQADYLVRAFSLAREQWDWVRLFVVWNIAAEPPNQSGQTSRPGIQAPAADSNPSAVDTTGEEGYSLIRPDGSLRPAFSALRNMPKTSAVEEGFQAFMSLLKPKRSARDFLILARDAQVHLGDSEYPTPWVPLYLNRNPSIVWSGEFYLRQPELSRSTSKPWVLSMELMQVNDFDSKVSVNDKPTFPAYLPAQDFTSIWVTARFQIPQTSLREGLNLITIQDGKVFPAFQQTGFTWDDFQFRNVILTAP